MENAHKKLLSYKSCLLLPAEQQVGSSEISEKKGIITVYNGKMPYIAELIQVQGMPSVLCLLES